ncbi:hypothetical protein KA078_00030 [Candidatus Woesebacteria bacterium]|nr:hypothetical protein [Candidatus Woesebacteria bacterium]
MTQVVEDGRVLRPEVPNLPAVPAGILRPDSAGVAVRDLPDGYVINSQGVIQPAATDAPVSILLPGQDEVSRYGVRTEAGQDVRGHHEDLLFFMSNPWNYLQNRMHACNLPSPIEEMKKQIADFKSGITDAEALLLRSPFEHIRSEVRSTLIGRYISEAQINGRNALDLEIINVANLEFISEAHEEESIESFYAFLERCIDELLLTTEGNNGELKHIAHVCQYLSVLTHTFLYRFGEYRLSSGAVLEKIAAKLEPLVTQPDLTKAYLQPILDFVSYFEMNASSASSVFLQLCEKNHVSHPLVHELRYQLGSEESRQQDVTQPKVGIEIEGVPLVIFGSVPDGFELGIDGGGTMPEFRRNDQELHFDATYKRSLYDLWHFARMTQFRGASIHIHLDHQGEEMWNRLKEKFGTDWNTLRTSTYKGTIEVRFNLTGYSQKDKTKLDLNSPFLPQQYDLVSFIEALIELGDGTGPAETTIDSLPRFWQLRFKNEKPDEKLLTYEQVYETGENSDWQWTVVDFALSKLEGFLTYEQMMTLCTHCAWDIDIFERALTLFKEKLTLEQLLELCERSDWNWDVIGEARSQLQGNFTYEQIYKIGEKSEWHWRVVDFALSKFEGFLTYEQMMTLCTLCEWDIDIFKRALILLNEKLTYEQLISFSKLPRLNKDLMVAALTHFGNTLTYDQFSYILIQSDWDANVVEAAVYQLKENLAFDQLLEIGIKSRWYADVSRCLFDKLENKLSFEQLLTLGTSSKWDLDLIEQAMKKLEGSLTYEQIIQLCIQSEWDIYATGQGLKKLESKLSLEQLMQLSIQSNWKYYVIEQAAPKLGENLTYEQFLDFCVKLQWAKSAVACLIPKLISSITNEQMVEICRKSNWNSEVVEQAASKLEKALTYEEFLDFCVQSEWNYVAIGAMLGKLEPNITYQQFLDIESKCAYLGSTIELLTSKLEGGLTSKQLLDLVRMGVKINDSLMTKVRGSISFEQIMKICNYSGWYLIEKVINKLENDITYEQVRRIAVESYGDVEVIKCALENFKGNITLKQVVEIGEICAWSIECLEFSIDRINELSLVEEVRENVDSFKDISNKKRGLFIWTLLLRIRSSYPISLARVMR